VMHGLLAGERFAQVSHLEKRPRIAASGQFYAVAGGIPSEPDGSGRRASSQRGPRARRAPARLTARGFVGPSHKSVAEVTHGQERSGNVFACGREKMRHSSKCLRVGATAARGFRHSRGEAGRARELRFGRDALRMRLNRDDADHSRPRARLSHRRRRPAR
jgi:hypothetical protein